MPDEKTYRIIAKLDNGDVVKGDASSLTERELDEALDLLTHVAGSKNGHISLRHGGITTIIPIQRIIMLQVQEVDVQET